MKIDAFGIKNIIGNKSQDISKCGLRLILTFFLLGGFSLIGFAQDALQKKALAAYENKNYPEAIELYTKILKEQGNSSSLYYNLGNAYYRNGDKGHAVLNYERAVKLNPRHKEAQANLDFVKSKLIDRSDADENIITVSLAGIRDLMSSNAWAVTGMALFLLFMGGAALYVFASSVTLKKVGFFGGLVLLAACVASNVFANNSRGVQYAKNYAIVLSDSTVLSNVSRAPIGKEEVAFVLHEGTKVEKLDSLKNSSDNSGTWYKVKTADGRDAWIAASAIEEI